MPHQGIAVGQTVLIIGLTRKSSKKTAAQTWADSQGSTGSVVQLLFCSFAVLLFCCFADRIQGVGQHGGFGRPRRALGSHAEPRPSTAAPPPGSLATHFATRHTVRAGV